MTQRYNLGPNHIRFFFPSPWLSYIHRNYLSFSTHTQRKSLGKSMIMIFFSVNIFSFLSPPSGLPALWVPGPGGEISNKYHAHKTSWCNRMPHCTVGRTERNYKRLPTASATDQRNQSLESSIHQEFGQRAASVKLHTEWVIWLFLLSSFLSAVRQPLTDLISPVTFNSFSNYCMQRAG